VSLSTPIDVVFAVDSDLTNFVTGACEVSVFTANTGVALDITGSFTVQIYTVPAAV
jgi:hypothetical protein